MVAGFYSLADFVPSYPFQPKILMSLVEPITITDFGKCKVSTSNRLMDLDWTLLFGLKSSLTSVVAEAIAFGFGGFRLAQ